MPEHATSIRRLWPLPVVEDADDDTIAAWYGHDEKEAGWVRVNFVSSLDGAATHQGLSGGLSSPPDKRVFDILRRLCDVVLVGAGTVRKEGYGAMRVDPASARWRAGHGLEAQPVFAIASSRLDLDPASAVFADAPVRPLVLTGRAAPEERREALSEVADVLTCGTTAVDATMMVGRLRQRGLTRVLCEGGPHLFGSMIAEAAIDELCLTMSPLLEGGIAGRIVAGLEAAVAEPLRLAHVLAAGDTLLLRYLASSA